MIEIVNKKLGEFIAARKFLNKSLKPVSFSKFIENAQDFLVILPDNDVEFQSSLEVIYSLAESGKNVSIFVRDYRVSLLKRKEHINIIDFGLADFTKLKLPSERIMEILHEKKIDVVLDLNMQENFYCTVISSMVNAPFKVCFQRGKMDKYYNLQIINRDTDSAISYKNLLNSLQMF